jgi:hypothetical protein
MPHTHGSPPLGTPAIVTPGFDPTTAAKNENSSANVLTANIAAKTQAITAIEDVFFMLENPSFLENRARSNQDLAAAGSTKVPPRKSVADPPSHSGA